MSYIFLEPIGEGSFGFIYKAKDRANGEYVAIKVFKDREYKPGGELATSHAINSPRVVQIRHYLEDDEGRHCLVMELVPGQTLAEFLKQKGAALTTDEAVRIASSIALALADMHEKGFVHRDLNPSNIRIQDNGDLKIVDLGHTCRIGTRTDLVQEGTIGTPPYLAPEQSTEGGVCDVRTDLYSLGVILCEMLSHRPFIPGNPDESIPPGLPTSLDATIRCCVDMEPSRRLGSADEVRNAISPSPPSLILPSWYRKAAVAAAILLTLALIAAMRYLKVELATAVPVTRTADAKQSNTGNPNAEPPPTRKKFGRRVAILDFSNLTGDTSLDHYSMGIPEIISVELANLKELTLVEPGGENQTTPQQAGKAASAALVVYGSFQRANRQLNLTAHVLAIDSNTEVATVHAIQKPGGDLFALQGDLGRQLAAAIQTNLSPAERHDLETATTTTFSGQAFQNFSNGTYYLRQNLPQEALTSFNATLAEYPNFPGVQYYRAQALEQLNQTDEAIDALKKALPTAEQDQPVLWRREFQSSARHGWINVLDTAHQQRQRTRLQNETTTNFQRRVVYAESTANGTLIHFVDPVMRTVKDQPISDTHVRFFTGTQDYAYSDGKTTVLTSVTVAADGNVTSVHYYAFANDGSNRWDIALPPAIGKDIPIAALIGNSFFIDMPAIHRVDVYDARTGLLRWSDPDLAIESAEVPVNAHTQKHGDIVMFKSKDTYRAHRLDENKDAWVVRGIQSTQVSQLITDKLLIIFEPERRILMVDLESGKIVHEIRMAQFVDKYNLAVGSIPVVAALVESQVLYVLSQNLELHAIDLNRGATVWKTTLPQRFQSIRIRGNRIFLVTESNNLLVMDRSSGKIQHTWAVLPESTIELADDKTVVLTANQPVVIYAVSPADGKELWRHDRVGLETNVANGLVTYYASLAQLIAVDPATGKFVWQHAGTLPWLHMEGNHLFVLSRDDLREYSNAVPTEKVSDRQLLTALARLYLDKHDLVQATAFAQRAAAIDPDYPPLALVRAHIYNAEKKTTEAGLELARYVDLAGVDTREGQQAMAEMMRDYGLQWETAIDGDVVGDPTLIGDRLAGVGRRSLPHLHVSALDLKTGKPAWRFAADRFVASVAGSFENRPVLWYVAGDADDATSLTLYRIDVGSNHREPVGTWKQRNRVGQVWIACTGNRVLVASASPDPTARTVEVVVNAVDGSSGKVLWQNDHHIANATTADLENPIKLFVAQDDNLTYTIGSQRLALNVSTHTPVNPLEVATSEPSRRVVNDTVAQEFDPQSGKVLAKHPILWTPHTFRIAAGRLYAFTSNGHAYAMNQ